MRAEAERVAARFYEGLWGVLARHLRVPREPPTLPATPAGPAVSFRPDPAFLDWLKWHFWIGCAVFDVLVLGGWIAVTVAIPLLGLVLLIPALAITVVPNLYAWVALHLRFDTTWYVMTDRSLRTRRGIWHLHEVTITFENVQNVKVVQGPLQRLCGVSSVVVETAGSGVGAGHDHSGSLVSNQGVIEGIKNAAEIRDTILARVRASGGAGLGDVDGQDGARRAGFGRAHVALLREIRDEVRELARA